MTRPIAQKYCEGKVKSILKRRLKELEIVKRETYKAIDWGLVAPAVSDIVHFTFEPLPVGGTVGSNVGVGSIPPSPVSTWARDVTSRGGVRCLGDFGHRGL